MKIVLVLWVFAAGLAFLVGERMGEAWQAVLVGAAIGFPVSVLTSIIISRFLLRIMMLSKDIDENR